MCRPIGGGGGLRWPSGLDRSTGDRTVEGFNPTGEKLFASELWQFRLPRFLSEETLKPSVTSIWCVLE